MADVEKIKRLFARLTPTRAALMQRALDLRTRKIVVVLEDIFQSHNASAVLRSCDAFGIQEVHAIENNNKLRVFGGVDMGASKWLDIHRYTLSEARRRRYEPRMIASSPEAAENTRAALQRLKNRGYLLAASTLRKDAIDISEVPVDKPLALMIGTELTGLSETAHEMADIKFSLQMSGFVQSLNLSVFCAVCLSAIASKMRTTTDDWKLSENEKSELLEDWLTRCFVDKEV